MDGGSEEEEMQRQHPAQSLGEAAKHISLWAQLPENAS